MRIIIGNCGECFFYEEGNCENSHFHDGGLDDENAADCAYSYDEGGSMEVGKNFGCVHFRVISPTEREQREAESLATT